ncbi:MAG: hypothetical protein Q8L85_08045 [Alphaproteobacteria bacterium]|nr:hypothetical protein [Alphaproteobacteria bacterium]
MLNGCSVPGFNVTTQTHTSTYTSYYGQSIECLGLMLPPEKVYKYTGLIASFLDKTGKGSITTAKPITQGAADLAADSLAKFKYFKIKTAIPHNFRDNPQIFEFNKQGTDFFVHGSIVILDSTHDQKSISIAINPVNFNHKVTRVVAIVHMSVNSSLDNTVFINDGGDLASGNFKAEWNIFQNDAGLFRLIGKKAINLSGSIQIQQAADLALHEAIELGLVNLVGRMFDLPYNRCLPRQDNDFSNVSSEIARLSYGRTPYRPATATQNHHAPQQPQSSQPHPNNAHHGQHHSGNVHHGQQHSNNAHHGQQHSNNAHHQKHSKHAPLSVESQPLEPLK